MWFIVLFVIILIVVAVVAIKNFNDKENETEKKEKANTENAQKTPAATKARNETYEKITESEKQQLTKLGVLDATLNAYNKAVKGEAQAMTFLGYTYKLHLKNPAKSAYWMQKAANAGDLDAKYWLGEYYMNGYGVTENRVKGTGMIIEVAKKGNKLAIESLLEEFHMPKAEMRSIGIPI